MKFEHISILKGNLTKDEVEEEIENFRDYFKEQNIILYRIENLGLKKLAYEVRGNREGNYLVINFTAENDKISGFEKFTRENDNVIKFITIKTENEEVEEEGLEDEEER